MWCCLLPIGVMLVVGPMFAAGRGPRAFLVSFATGWGVVLLLAVLNGRATLDLLADWRENVPELLPFAVLFGASLGAGGLVLFARWAEDRRPDGSHCRQCGYDLRASPGRCPECGTVVGPTPEQV